MLLMHNDSLVSIGEFNFRLRAFKTARKIRELVPAHNTNTAKT